MKNEERHLENIAGKGNPFRTPEGYFESFADKFMAELPEREVAVTAGAETVAGSWRHTKLWSMVAGIAASVCIAIGGAALYLSQTDATQSQLISDTYFTDAEAEVYETEMVDYAMMDNMDIYAYMADE